MSEKEAKRLIDRLPDTYAKESGSRLFRFFRIFGAELGELREAIETTGRVRDVDQASGKTLDFIGANVQQPRGRLPDATYRGLIKAKIARHLSRGDVDSIKGIVAMMLDVDRSVVVVTPQWNLPGNEPAAVEISAPLDALARYEIGPDAWSQIASLIVAGGVRVLVLLRGTFQFSTQAAVSEYDPDKGFADLGQTFGGKLGAFYDAPAEDLPL